MRCCGRPQNDVKAAPLRQSVWIAKGRNLGFLDFIAQLRTDRADPDRAAKGMLILGAVSMLAAFWNFFIYKFFPELPVVQEGMPSQIPFELVASIFVTLILIGLVFIIAAQGIRRMKPWGKRLGQAGVVAFAGSIIIFLPWAMTSFIPFEELFVPFTTLVFIIVSAQFVVPAYFGIRYLGRLPVREAGFIKEPESFEELSHEAMAAPGQTYRHSPFPFGAFFPFIIFILLVLIVCMSAVILAGLNDIDIGLVLIPTVLAVFAAPVIYNRFTSHFERNRKVVASFTGGVSILIFSASPPFSRLLVYEDGIEIRVLFQCFFIPYDRMADLDQKPSFFFPGFVIKSDLPDVPTRIRYAGVFGGNIDKVLAAVKNQRDLFMSRIKND